MISSLDIKYSAEYIANIFWSQDIAKVASITLVPQISYLNNDTFISNIAYIKFATYLETEIAYKFVIKLKKKSFEFIHDEYDGSSWIIELNTHNSGDINAGPYTTVFNNSYFEDDERPIIDIYGREFTVEEARLYVSWLKYEEITKKEEELLHLENELRIHKALQNSQNVTVRDKYWQSNMNDWSCEQKEINVSVN